MTIFTFANGINTTLASAISSSATSLTLSSSAGLPTSIASGEYLVITLRDAATQLQTEIVYASAISGATLTVVRAQEGTTAQAWSTGDYAYSGVTAGQMGSVNAGRLISIQYVASSATVTTPNGATKALARQVGAGAGGLYCQTQGSPGNLTYMSGAGGGSGAYAEWEASVTSGQSITVTIGAGGGSNANGGSTTVVIGSQSVVAGGGISGIWNDPTSSSGGQGGAVTTTGSPTIIAVPGGGWGGDGVNGNFIFSGNGGSSYFGGGGRAGTATAPNGTTQANSAGKPALAYGAGGGGAYNTALQSATFYFGGLGANGFVILEFYS